MSDLDDLYQDIIIDHSSRPRNFRVPEDANRSAEGYNPLCGDRITLYLKMDGDRIADIGFQGSGCAISKATSSLMTENLKGKDRAEAKELFDLFRNMVTRDPQTDFDDERLGDLEILSGLTQFPVRIKCATLSWHTMAAALEGKNEASTE